MYREKTRDKRGEIRVINAMHENGRPVYHAACKYESTLNLPNSQLTLLEKNGKC